MPREAGGIHGWSRLPSRSGGVVKLGRGQGLGGSSGAAGHEHPAVIQYGAGLPLARLRHRGGGPPAAQLGGVGHGVASDFRRHIECGEGGVGRIDFFKPTHRHRIIGGVGIHRNDGPFFGSLHSHAVGIQIRRGLMDVAAGDGPRNRISGGGTLDPRAHRGRGVDRRSLIRLHIPAAVFRLGVDGLIPDLVPNAEFEQRAVQPVRRVAKVDLEALGGGVQGGLLLVGIILEDHFRKGIGIKDQPVGTGATSGAGRDEGVAGIAGRPHKAVAIFVFRPLDAQAGGLSRRQQVDAGIRPFHPIKKHFVGIEVLPLRKIDELPVGEGTGCVEGQLGIRPGNQRRSRIQARLLGMGDDLLAEFDFRGFGGGGLHDLHHIGSQKYVLTRGDFRSEIFHQNPPLEIVGRELADTGQFFIPQGALDLGRLARCVGILHIARRAVSHIHGGRELGCVNRIGLLDPAIGHDDARAVEGTLRPIDFSHRAGGVARDIEGLLAELPSPVAGALG